MTLSADELKRIACEAIDKASEDLNQLSQDLWNNPELAFQEKYAHDRLCTFLHDHGFPVVERNFILDTAFRAKVSAGCGPNVALLCEYDALPDIGHACGHNLIAEVGAGASLGVKAALDKARENGQELGELTTLGAPAEESGGGKIHLIEGGAFKDVTVAMMAHPHGPQSRLVMIDDHEIAIAPYVIWNFKTNNLTTLGCPAEECGGGGKIDLIEGGAFSDTQAAMMCHPYPLTLHLPLKFAMQIVTIRYYGKAAHAAGFPWEGVNALDAAVMAYSSISCMRQQMKPTWRIHGVITNGGAKPNIIPEKAELEYYIRAPTLKELNVLIEMSKGCFQSAATATGCSVEIEWHSKPYANVMTNWNLAEVYKSNAENIGVDFCKDELKLTQASGSTDMGNVSHVVPSIHPMFHIGTNSAPHTRDFNVASGKSEAQKYTIDQAKALAMTTLDCFCSEDLLKNIKTEFDESLRKES